MRIPRCGFGDDKGRFCIAEGKEGRNQVPPCLAGGKYGIEQIAIENV
jgi:hypothetical protein